MDLKIKKIPDRITILCMVLFFLLIVIPKKFFSKEISIILILCLLELITYFIHIQYFNEMDQFDKDSKYICSLIFIPPVTLFFFLILGKCTAGAEKFIGSYAIFSVIAVIFFLFYFWLIYLYRCKKVIDDINKNWHVFLMKMIKPMSSAVLLCISIAVIINLSLGPSDKKLIYQMIDIILSSSFPFIGMYVYVASEIDEFEKHEEKRREELEKEKYKYDLYNY